MPRGLSYKAAALEGLFRYLSQDFRLKSLAHSSIISPFENAISDCANRISRSPSIFAHSSVRKALKISHGRVVSPAALPIPITVQVSRSLGEYTSVAAFLLHSRFPRRRFRIS
ncbi:hypothetical protein FOXG_17976 [Fusarium oxysporum f. sp. lycopersici 4287]|uniref:Uncharacterized protein n=1 Tax=Fusarium oxysporum f. sp. lycopersici (strain 4287 / CBS 123668 / FGSC 9935 / NRRL 34936) TaxID=426428 RepID=A0A0J9U7U0_FUSO4|nr:hypothetical protein FOXG_17976 [Fusarium oxysporum f. sp. lycopersici 4287]KNA95243.1 hypothetical protein FOXG_17976 [Fusarium oxysporum f. sp. lycopersici 4287]